MKPCVFLSIDACPFHIGIETEEITPDQQGAEVHFGEDANYDHTQGKPRCITHFITRVLFLYHKLGILYCALSVGLG